MCSYTGTKTDDSTIDRRVVKDSAAEGIWWGHANIETDKKNWKLIWERAVNFLSTRPKLYVVDGYAGADPRYRIPVRFITARTYHALYASNLLELETNPVVIDREFNQGAEYHIVDCGEFPSHQFFETHEADAIVMHNYGEKR